MTESNANAVPPHVTIYTDGGCEPNPGRGGYGAILIHPKKRLEISGGFRRTTNNRMEIFAAIVSLEALKQPCQVTVHSDSEYLVNAMTKGWAESWKRKQWWRKRTERVPNRDLWERLLAVCLRHKVEFRWVQGHAGHAENERCDQLAMEALRKPNLEIDAGFEDEPVSGDVRPDMQEGDPCRKCSTPVVKRAGRAKRGRDHYYEFHLWCAKCAIAYHVESAKQQVEKTPSLF